MLSAACVTLEHIAAYPAAWAWFVAEHQVLLGVVARAAETGFDRHVDRLASAMATFLHRHGSWHDRVTVEGTAVAAARRLGDEMAEARAHQGLGYVHLRPHKLADAETHLRQAVALRQRHRDDAGRSRCHVDLALVFEQQGNPTRALAHAAQALRLARQADHRANQARALNAVGWFHAHLGHHHQALAHCLSALNLHRTLRNRRGEADTSDSLGFTYHGMGDHRRPLRTGRYPRPYR